LFETSLREFSNRKRNAATPPRRRKVLLRLSAIPDLYSAIAQSAAAKAASFADFLEEILRIDDIGYLPLAHEQANLFFQVVFG